MKPITYLCFTLLSIVIQFCLMDYINDQRAIDDTLFGSNGTLDKNLSDILEQKPHALFYRIEKNKFKENKKDNTGTALTTSTEITTTIFDLVYDENVSASSSDSTTETLFTSSEFDNVTEITFFDHKPSTSKPQEIPKKISTNKCYCNLLYKTCDINCCCDNDCSDQERSMLNCEENGKEKCSTRSSKGYLHMCSSHFACNKDLQSDVFGYLFCIAKVNMPQNQKISINMVHALDVDNQLKWHANNRKSRDINFTKDLYNTGQPIMIVTNESVNFLELPFTRTNEYCNGYRAVNFLTNEHIRCHVKLKDLHMLDAIKTSEKTNVASPKTNTANSTKMDCTTLHCINWTTLVCKEHNCTKYDSEIHEPLCSESRCINIGVKVEYEFYCNASIITRVVVKFHVRTVSMALQYVTQEITVNFYMGNNSINNVVKFSGSHGYIKGLPIIVSLSESNHTENFYNNTSGRIHFWLPHNRDGGCVLTNLTHNILKFGYNKRIKCRISYILNSSIHNGTEGCLKIQEGIEEYSGLGHTIYISPYGNPQGLGDDKWINLQKFNTSNIYGEHRRKDSKLLCYNLVTRILFILAYRDTNDEDRDEFSILSTKVESTTKNVTFNLEDLSTVITVDINFVDATTQTIHDYVGAPHFSFHLPRDFFFPLSSNECHSIKFNASVLFLYLFLCLCN